MTLVELPSNDGRIIAVNPHHVTSCQPYTGLVAGRHGPQEMTAVWVAGNTTHIHVCVWPIANTLEVLHAARKKDFAAFEAGWHAFRIVSMLPSDPTPDDLRAAFLLWQGVDEEPVPST